MNTLTSSAPLSRLFRLICITLLIAIALWVPLVSDGSLVQPPGGGDEPDYDNIAWNLSEGRGLSLYFDSNVFKYPYNSLDPRPQFTFSPAPSPTTYRPPLYPIYLAGSMELVGRSFDLLRILQLGMITLCLVYFFSVLLSRFGALPAGFTVLFVVFDPVFRDLARPFLTEGLTLALSALLCGITLSDHLSRVKMIAGALLFGLLVLTRTSYLLWLPLLLLFGVIFAIQKKLSWKLLITTLILFLATLAPWIYRNCSLTDGRYPLGTQGTINLPVAYSEVNYNARGLWNGRFANDLYRAFEKIPAGVEREVAQADAASEHFRKWLGEHWQMIPSLMLRRVHSLLWRHAPTVQRVVFLLGCVAALYLLLAKHWGVWLILPVVAQILTVALTWNVGEGRFFVPMYAWLWGLICVGLSVLLGSEHHPESQNS